MFFNIARYASYHKFFEKVRASAEKQEIDDPRLPRKRNVSNHYGERQATAELFVSKVEEHYHQILYQAILYGCNSIRDRFQQKYYIETLQTMEMLLLKVFH